MSQGRIAFIDDEADLCAAAEDWLTASGFSVATWSAPLLARQELDTAAFDAVVIDLRMPDLMGNRLMLDLHAREADLPIILMSAHADVPAAVAAMRQGAHDFLEKPYLPEHLVAVLERAVEWRRLKRDLSRSPAPQSRQERLEQAVLGRSEAITHLRRAMLQLADTHADLLIRGPQGSGREAIARLMHEMSRRARRPFVALDCQAISAEEMEIELFGYERGSQPGLSRERPSRFEQINGGTLYLAEIEALSPALQMRLFRVLQDKCLTRSGGHLARPVDIRLIASSRLDLDEEMRAQRFRQDLYFRLAAASLRTPALAERLEDLATLYLHYLQQAAAKFRRPLPEPSPAQFEALSSRDWQGNLAELQAEAERHVLGLGPSRLSHAPSHRADEAMDKASLAEKMAIYEMRLISEALEAAEGSSAKAAEALGLPRRTLNEKIARLGVRGSG